MEKLYYSLSYKQHMCAGAPRLCRHRQDVFLLVKLRRARSWRGNELTSRHPVHNHSVCAHEARRWDVGTNWYWQFKLACLVLFRVLANNSLLYDIALRHINCEGLTSTTIRFSKKWHKCVSVCMKLYAVSSVLILIQAHFWVLNYSFENIWYTLTRSSNFVINKLSAYCLRNEYNLTVNA
jgi:hypothetical protein